MSNGSVKSSEGLPSSVLLSSSTNVSSRPRVVEAGSWAARLPRIVRSADVMGRFCPAQPVKVRRIRARSCAHYSAPSARHARPIATGSVTPRLNAANRLRTGILGPCRCGLGAGMRSSGRPAASWLGKTQLWASQPENSCYRGAISRLNAWGGFCFRGHRRPGTDIAGCREVMSSNLTSLAVNATTSGLALVTRGGAAR